MKELSKCCNVEIIYCKGFMVCPICGECFDKVSGRNGPRNFIIKPIASSKNNIEIQNNHLYCERGDEDLYGILQTFERPEIIPDKHWNTLQGFCIMCCYNSKKKYTKLIISYYWIWTLSKYILKSNLNIYPSEMAYMAYWYNKFNIPNTRYNISRLEKHYDLTKLLNLIHHEGWQN